MKNFLSGQYNKLRYELIPTYFKNYFFKYKGIEVTTKPITENLINNIQYQPNDSSSYKSKDSEALLMIDLIIRNTSDSTDESVQEELNVPLCLIPILHPKGFLRGGTYYSAISKLSPASGWFLKNDDKDGPYMSYLNPYGEVLRIFFHKEMPYVAFVPRKKNSVNKQGKVNIFVFLKALTGLSYSQILTKINNPCMICTYYKIMSNELSVEDCAHLVRNSMTGNKDAKCNLATIVEDFRNYFSRVTSGGVEKIPRFNSMNSFNRFKKYKVLETVPNNPDLCGKIISRKLANEMDEMDITHAVLKDIESDNRIEINNVKLSEDNLSITADEFITAANDLFIKAFYNLGNIDSDNDYGNQVSTSIDKYIMLEIKRLMFNLEENLFEKVADGGHAVSSITKKSIAQVFEKPVSIMYEIMHRGSNNLNSVFVQPEGSNSVTQNAQSSKVIKIKSKELRKIHPTQIGLIDAWDSPESEKVGLSVSTCSRTGVDKYNMLSQPVYKVINGKVDDSQIYMVNAVDLRSHIVALCDKRMEYTESVQNCILDGFSVDAEPFEIDYKMVYPDQTQSPIINSTCYASCNGPKRQPMLSSAVKSASPCIRPDRPWNTARDVNDTIGIYKCRDILEEYMLNNGKDINNIPDDVFLRIVTLDTSDNIIAKFTMHHSDGTEYSVSGICACSIELDGTTNSISKTIQEYRYNPPVNQNGMYGLDDIVFFAADIDMISRKLKQSDGSMIDSDHDVALGQNVTVLFKIRDGFNYEDASLINERFANRLGLATLQVFSVKDNNIDNPDNIKYSSHNLSGLPKVGKYLYPDDVVIRRWVTNPDTGITKEKPIRLKAKEEGLVLSAKIKSDNNKMYVEVLLCNVLKLQPGDKISGCHGNKSVISIIVPEEDMEYDETGRTPDIILNPQGNIQRENTGQMLEELQFEVSRKNNIVQQVEICSKFDISKMCEEAKNIDVVPTTIYNPKTGEPYPTKAMIGTMYMFRTIHVSTSKYNATNTASDMINTISHQPNKGSGGGQRKGEMEQWCWWAAGTTKLSQIMSTLQSDDPTARGKLRSHFESTPLVPYGVLEDEKSDDNEFGTISSNIERLQAWHRFLGFDCESDGNSYKLQPLTMERINQIVPGPLVINPFDPHGDSSILKNQDIFGSTRLPNNFDDIRESSNKYGKMKLPAGFEIIMPIMMTSQSFANLIYGYHFDSDTDRDVLKHISTKTLSSICKGEKLYVGLTNIVVSDDSNTIHYMNNVFIITKNPQNPELAFFGVKKWANTALEFFKLLPDYNFDGVVDYVKSNFFTKSAPNDFVNNRNLSELDSYDTLINFKNAFGHPKNLLVDKILIAPNIYRPTNSVGQSCGTLSTATYKLYSAVRNNNSNNIWKTLCNIAGILFPKETDGSKLDDINCIKGMSYHKSRNSVYRDVLLSKNVNFSGRSVIVPNPYLKIGSAGIPIKILVKICAYHLYGMIRQSNGILYQLSGGDKLSGKNVLLFKKTEHVLTSIANDNFSICYDKQTFNNAKEELIKFLNQLAKIYPVELNRAPSLWKNSTSFFKFIPVDGNVIQVHPLICDSYNADFDGDQMAISIPMHIEAIKDASKLISGRDIRNEHNGEILYSINQDMILGCYYYTNRYNKGVIKHMMNCSRESLDTFCNDTNKDGYFINDFENLGIKELYDLVELNLLKPEDEIVLNVDGDCYKSSCGRIIFNSLFGSSAFTSEIGEDGLYKLKYDNSINKSAMSKLLSDFVKEMYVEHEAELDYENELVDNAVYDSNSLKFISGNTSFESIFDIVLEGSRKYYLNTIDRLKSFGFYGASMSGTTLSLYDFEEVKSTFDNNCTAINDATNNCRILESWEEHQTLGNNSNKIRAEIWSECGNIVSKKMKEAVPKDSNLYNIIESGARGNYDNIVRICGMVGVVKDSDGNPTKMPIRSPYIGGLSAIESQQNSFNGRNIQVATQQGAPKTGVATRNMVYLNDHIKTSSADEYCESKSTLVPIRYAIDKNKVNFQLNPEPVADWSSDKKSDWKTAISVINTLQGSLAISEEVCSLLVAFDSLSIIDFNENKTEINTSDYIIVDEKSKSRLLYRCIDLNRMVNEKLINESQFELIRESCKFINNNYYTLEKTADIITNNHIKAVYIWTILNCSMYDGTICKRCYGLSTTTLNLFKGSSASGIIAAQAIGENEMQAVQDIHKYGAVSASVISTLLIENPMAIGSVPDDINNRKIKKLNKSMITTLMPNAIKNSASVVKFHNYTALEFKTQNSVKIKEDGSEFYDSDKCYHIFVDRFDNLLNLPISTLPVGSPIVKYSSYVEQMKINGFLPTVVNIWYDYMNAIGSKFDARIFEIVIRSLSEYAIIDEVKDNTSSLHKGEIIPRFMIKPEDKEKVSYTNIVLGRRQAIKYSRKVLANIMWQNCKRGLSYASLNNIESNCNSLIDMSALGEVEGTKKKFGIPYDKSIKKDSLTKPYESVINSEFDNFNELFNFGNTITEEDLNNESSETEIENPVINPEYVSEISEEIPEEFPEEEIPEEEKDSKEISDDSTHLFG